MTNLLTWTLLRKAKQNARLKDDELIEYTPRPSKTSRRRKLNNMVDETSEDTDHEHSNNVEDTDEATLGSEMMK